MIIPVLMIGSFSLLLMTFPIPAYMHFIETACSGLLFRILSGIHDATLGMLSVYMTLSVSISYGRIMRGTDSRFLYGSPLTALACFCIITGFFSDSFDILMFSGRGMFSALLAAVAGSLLYDFFSRKIRPAAVFFADGTDVIFNSAIKIIIPAALVICCFSAVNCLIMDLCNVSSIQALFIRGVNGIFRNMGRSFFSGLLFICLSSLLWFCGIHGSNVLENVVQEMFVSVPAGSILSKTFFEVFVLLGGCGVSLGLLISLLLFSRRKCNRRLAKLSCFPILFNINEPMVFGLPIIYNRYLLVPFLLTPALCYIVSYAAVYLGLVPPVSTEISWTTPAIIGGFVATGSVRGCLLQLVNIALSVLLYRPFIVMLDKRNAGSMRSYIGELVSILKESEESTQPVELTGLNSAAGMLAKSIANDLQSLVLENEVDLNYQPQYDTAGKCIGAEALLRFNHPVYGILYPPLVIKLARESNCLWQLEKKILEKAISDSAVMRKKFGENFKLSVNVTVSSLHHEDLEQYLAEMCGKYQLRPGNICLEITEETALQLGENTEELFSRLRKMGYMLALDDFSMGHTSLKYLQGNCFDIVKLDGSLVRNLLENPRCRDIIASIMYLSKSLDFSVLAEYVENEMQQKELEKVDCRMYQGHLYSAAVSLEDLLSGK